MSSWKKATILGALLDLWTIGATQIFLKNWVHSSLSSFGTSLKQASVMTRGTYPFWRHSISRSFCSSLFMIWLQIAGDMTHLKFYVIPKYHEWIALFELNFLMVGYETNGDPCMERDWKIQILEVICCAHHDFKMANCSTQTLQAPTPVPEMRPHQWNGEVCVSDSWFRESSVRWLL